MNSTAFVSFEDDAAATDAALWLRSEELRGGKVKCSIKLLARGLGLCLKASEGEIRILVLLSEKT